MSYGNHGTDTRNAYLVVGHLVSEIGTCSTTWEPGDGTQYVLGLHRIGTGSYAGDHVLTVVVAQEATSIYLPAHWHADGLIRQTEQLRQSKRWMALALEPIIEKVMSWKRLQWQMDHPPAEVDTED